MPYPEHGFVVLRLYVLPTTTDRISALGVIYEPQRFSVFDSASCSGTHRVVIGTTNSESTWSFLLHASLIKDHGFHAPIGHFDRVNRYPPSICFWLLTTFGDLLWLIKPLDFPGGLSLPAPHIVTLGDVSSLTTVCRTDSSYHHEFLLREILSLNYIVTSANSQHEA